MANPFFITRNTQGSPESQNVLEDLINTAIDINGVEMFYIPRTIIGMDEVFGEDRLSEFNHSYAITVYFENIDNLAGQGAFLSKFGLQNEYAATVSMARRAWNKLVLRYGQTNLPTRPSEGDLLYFPMTKGLFEIKFVQDKDPFYQLGKLYIWKLDIELFQYSSEKINTGIPDIDIFEELKSYDEIVNEDINDSVDVADNEVYENESTTILVNKFNPLVR